MLQPDAISPHKSYCQLCPGEKYFLSHLKIFVNFSLPGLLPGGGRAAVFGEARGGSRRVFSRFVSDKRLLFGMWQLAMNCASSDNVY